MAGTKHPHKPDCNCPFCKNERVGAKTAISIAARGEWTNSIAPQTLQGEPVKAVQWAAMPELDSSGAIVVKNVSRQGKAAEWVLLKMQGKTNKEIAVDLGICDATLRSILREAHREGWIVFDDPKDKLEHVIAPKAVSTIDYFLDKKTEHPALAARVAIETAKGIGLFQSHQAIKVENDQPQAILALNIDVSGNISRSMGGLIIGKPKILDGEIISALPENGTR